MYLMLIPAKGGWGLDAVCRISAPLPPNRHESCNRNVFICCEKVLNSAYMKGFQKVFGKHALRRSYTDFKILCTKINVPRPVIFPQFGGDTLSFPVGCSAFF